MAVLDLEWLIAEGIRWIGEQRERFRNIAVPITSALTREFDRYFSAATIEAARVAVVGRIENPDFYATIERAGQPIPLDFSEMHGIAYIDTILVREVAAGTQALRSLVFHELVHVAQYQHLGLGQFVNRYVVGWAENGRDYCRIPLERDAFELQAKFEQSFGNPFSVEQAVASRLGQGLS